MINNPPIFSVIIPVYNKESTIARSLESVLRQEFRSFEVIVVDDGSVDGSIDVVQKFVIANGNVALLTQKNSGVSAARNSGVAAASGQWMVFLDADDYLLSGYLDELYKIIQMHPDVAMIGTGFYIKSGGCFFAPKSMRIIESIDLFAEFKPNSIPFHTSSHAILRSAFNEVGGYNPSLSFYEDAELMFRVAHRFKVARSTKALSVYADDGDNRLSRVSASDDFIRMPHIDYLEGLAKDAEIRRTELLCAKRWVFYMLIQARSDKARVRIQDRFPNIFDSFTKWTGVVLCIPVLIFVYKYAFAISSRLTTKTRRRIPDVGMKA